MMVGRFLVGIGFCLVIFASAFLDGALYSQAVALCTIGALMMAVPVAVTYILPLIQASVRRLIARRRPYNGMRVIITREED